MTALASNEAEAAARGADVVDHVLSAEPVRYLEQAVRGRVRSRTAALVTSLVATGVMVLLGTLTSTAPVLVLVAVACGVAPLAVRPVDLGLRSGADLARQLGTALVVTAATVALLDLGREAVLAAWMVLAAGTAVVAAGWVLARRSSPRVVLVGSSHGVQRALAGWADRPGLHVSGAVVVDCDSDGRWVPQHADGTPEGRWAPVVSVVEECDADLVVCLSDGGLLPADLSELGWAMEGHDARVVVTSPLAHAAPARLRVRRLAGQTMTVVAPSRPGAVVGALKSTLDRTGAVVALLLLAPLLVTIALLVRLDSSGAAVFRQVRVGRDGTPFTMYKFRTMVADAEKVKHLLADRDEGNGVLFKMHADPRITRVGRWLRRTSLDELPQLVNVLRGEMSLVGPRPALPTEVAGYDVRARRRLVTRPGMTGLWQVSGRSDLGWEESLALDLDYTDNISLGRDLAICLSTVQAVTTGRGAY